jgi:hypothetical protein
MNINCHHKEMIKRVVLEELLQTPSPMVTCCSHSSRHHFSGCLGPCYGCGASSTSGSLARLLKRITTLYWTVWLTYETCLMATGSLNFHSNFYQVQVIHPWMPEQCNPLLLLIQSATTFTPFWTAGWIALQKNVAWYRNMPRVGIELLFCCQIRARWLSRVLLRTPSVRSLGVSWDETLSQCNSFH